MTGYGTDDALETYYRQVERPQPKSRNIESLSRWLEGNKPLSMSESSFLDDWDDLTGPDHETDQGGLDAIAASFGAILHGWGLPRVGRFFCDYYHRSASDIVTYSCAGTHQQCQFLDPSRLIQNSHTLFASTI